MPDLEDGQMLSNARRIKFGRVGDVGDGERGGEVVVMLGMSSSNGLPSGLAIIEVCGKKRK